MKITLNWLREYVDYAGSPADLAASLTALGIEVEHVTPIAGEFTGVVVAEVLTRDKHPNADKLSVCRVADGAGERQIVCGAQNFKPGDKVPLILPGASLPSKPGEPPFTIKVGKIRGVESHGMMCSPQELGLAADADGLLILDPAARVGQPFAEFLGRSSGDVVFDLEITPNRPDLNSLLGIAREMSALTGAPLRLPETEFPTPPDAPDTASLTTVRVLDPDLCPRYTARVVCGVTVGPSPAWLRDRLEKVGVRSINNVVDLTNYVMLETGQPLHAFDLRRLQPGVDSRPSVIVRRASAAEKITTLDGQLRSLHSEMLLIADASRPIALAGVMGGENTEIQPDTRDLLVETACFQPANIRRTSKTLGLRSESSYRFERGTDPAGCDWVSRRAVRLILQLAGGQAAGNAIDAFPDPAPAREITLRHSKTRGLLGVEIPGPDQDRHLERLGITPVRTQPGGLTTFAIPSFRLDLKREADLIEEIARLHGVDRIPSSKPRAALGAHPFDSVYDQIHQARALFAGLGLNEAQGQTLISAASARWAEPDGTWVPIANPLSADMNALRPSLLPGLIASLRNNASHHVLDAALFEIGRVFTRNPAGGSPIEERRLAVALTGRRSPPFWAGADRDAAWDVYSLKGTLEEFLERYGLRGVVFQPRGEPTSLFAESAAVSIGGKVPIGQLGQLNPRIAREADLRHPVFLAEFNLDQLLLRRNTARSFKPLPQFPSIRRDVALLVAEETTHEQIIAASRRAKAPNLESVELFDVFRGPTVPAGHKSLAYGLIYRSAERTLTDAEVSAQHERWLAAVTTAVAAKPR